MSALTSVGEPGDWEGLGMKENIWGSWGRNRVPSMFPSSLGDVKAGLQMASVRNHVPSTQKYPEGSISGPQQKETPKSLG